MWEEEAGGQEDCSAGLLGDLSHTKNCPSEYLPDIFAPKEEIFLEVKQEEEEFMVKDSYLDTATANEDPLPVVPTRLGVRGKEYNTQDSKSLYYSEEGCMVFFKEENSVKEEAFIKGGTIKEEHDEYCKGDTQEVSEEEGQDEDLEPCPLKKNFIDEEFDTFGEMGRSNMTKTKKEKNEKFHQCKECEKKFVYKHDLKRHIATVHQGVKFHQCLECEKKFGQKHVLKRHLATVHQEVKSHQCHVCQKKFGRKDKLIVHTATVHQGKKPFQCPEPGCGTAYGCDTQLSDHMRARHNHNRLVCGSPGCGDSFTSRSGLNKHMRTHTGEKPYVCLECGTGFSVGSTLKRHMRTHSEQKPHSLWHTPVVSVEQDWQFEVP